MTRLDATAALDLLRTRQPEPMPGASLGCAMCGACCDPVQTSWDVADRIVEAQQPDPAVTFADEPPEFVTMVRREWLNARFTTEHWHVNTVATAETREDLGRTDVFRWTCDAFDPDTRLCTAHEDRPPVCSSAPFYDGAPRASFAREPLAPDGLLGVDVVGAGRAHCSYLLAVRPSARPSGVRPLIPLEVLNA